MAIVGKAWTAVLYRTWPTIGGTATPQITVLDFDRDNTSEAQIASLYGLTWDEANAYTSSALVKRWLPQSPTLAPSGLNGHGPYDTDEAAMLDQQNYFEQGVIASGGEWPGNGAALGLEWIKMQSSVWLGNGVDDGTIFRGSPETLWALFPDANTYNITTAAPFGTALGNGLIRHQALYHLSGNTDFGAAIAGQYPDPPPESDLVGPGTTPSIPIGVVDQTYIFTPVDDGSGTGGSVNDGGGDGTTSTDGLTVRCWAFSLDGHDFYVLRLGDSATFVYDLTTGSWSEWETPGRTNWRAHVGQNWIGWDAFGDGDTDVFAGDDASGTIWRLNANALRDARSDTTNGTDDKITHVVVGGIEVVGRNVIPCNAVTLDVALGEPTQTGASIRLEISDDLGETWIDCDTQEVVASDFTAVLEWRGLGQIKAPGRLFRFTDDGATVSFRGADLR